MNRPEVFRVARLPCIAFALLAPALLARAAEAPVPAKIEFNRDVRPVLSNTCFKCHGADVKTNVSGLRLDRPEIAYAAITAKSGRTYTPIVPGRPEVSELVRRIKSPEPTEVMPPPDALHQLSDRDRTVLERWIAQGAGYQDHWSYVAPKKVVPPPAPAGNAIDGFVRAKLAALNLAPAPEADRRTLIRRVSLDLTGLPPTPEETDAFVADPSVEAYEQLVDRFLASPHYGERMAVSWLDLVRFADSVGFHGDQLFNNFPYRDYVIDAFNSNLPFDQFTREQLAGDLLPQPTDAQQVASGFNRLNMVTREGGAQPKEYIAKYAAERVRTVSSTWLGSTMACAECHDHKFDPISTRDFYALSAYFADIKQWGVYAESDDEPELKGYGINHPFPPEIEVDNPYLQRREARIRRARETIITSAVDAIAKNPDTLAEVRRWAAHVVPRLAPDRDGWALAMPESAEGRHGIETTVLPDGGVRFVGAPGKSWDKHQTLVATMRAPAGPLASVRLEALPDETTGGAVVRGEKSETFALKFELAVRRAGNESSEPVEIAEAFAEQEAETYFNGHVSTSVRTEWVSSRKLTRSPQSAVYHLARPITLGEDDRLIVTVISNAVAQVRASVSPLGGRLVGESLSDDEIAALAATEPTPEQVRQAATVYFQSTGQPDPVRHASLFQTLREIAACRGGRAYSIVTVAVEPRETRVLPRGNWQDDTGEIVQPAPPHFLPGGQLAPDAPRQTRLDLAHWLTSRENPLTARTFVNRLWKQFFGIGLSSVLDDLGAQGEYPSHPELLDWLAVEFMDRDWDVKAIVRLIVTSTTYRQASRVRPELADVDPGNRLLARQSPRRLEAEFVRDNALFAAGLLHPELGGPSAHPYQPAGYYEPLNFPAREYAADTDERQYRRGVYTHWQRTFLHPMLANFDAPSREECTAARTVSSTPQQALTLLNDPTFVEAARALAIRVLLETPAADFEPRLDTAYRHVLARPPTERERTSLTAFYAAQLAHYREEPAEAEKLTTVGLHPTPASLDRVELAAWTAVARALLNLNETIVAY